MGRGLWVRVRGEGGIQTKAAQFLPCGTSSQWPPPASPGSLSTLSPSALLSGPQSRSATAWMAAPQPTVRR